MAKTLLPGDPGFEEEPPPEDGVPITWEEFLATTEEPTPEQLAELEAEYGPLPGQSGRHLSDEQLEAIAGYLQDDLHKRKEAGELEEVREIFSWKPSEKKPQAPSRGKMDATEGATIRGPGNPKRVFDPRHADESQMIDGYPESPVQRSGTIRATVPEGSMPTPESGETTVRMRR